MPVAAAIQQREQRLLSLRGACEKSARSLVSAIRRTAPANASTVAMTDMLDSLTGVIERSARLLLVEDDEALTTQQAADLLNVSRPHLVKLLETRQIVQLPKAGRHRRVSRAAVLQYKQARDMERKSALKELATLSQRHRLGY